MNQQSKYAFLFPGQGAQAVGMGYELYQESDEAKTIFDSIDTSLGRSLTKIMFEGPEDELRETINAQPAILAVSLACLHTMRSEMGDSFLSTPAMMAGHSLGEYSALAASGALSVTEASLLVQKRGELMQLACDQNPGTMAAILGMDQEEIFKIAKTSGTYVSNINTQEQIVISGEKEKIQIAMDMASEKGAKRVIPLNVGGAFHSGLMEPARDGLAAAVESVKLVNSSIPIVANCTAKPVSESSDIKEELVTQISGCVNWRQTIEFMIDEGVTDFYEIGPGRALSGMVKKINKEMNTYNISDLASIRELKNT
ncbi:MAG: ACP S-malonyltransferase [SAR202 cluster bacterium]|nr:ACP S-malonyltransferase [SAR202 cluster bacterium]|tara:strand:- start:4909 stop:5847 length:939 start_codon:yes stop_codon:yes gene_type:complete